MYISKGLDIPIKGAVKITNYQDRLSAINKIAIIGCDYNGMRPQMDIQIGSKVSLGDQLFSDKKNPKVIYTAMGSGTVTAINRGDKRLFISLEIELDHKLDNLHRTQAFTEPVDLSQKHNDKLSETIKQKLLSSGLWTSLRTRPFSKVPSCDSIPDGIFVSTIDTRPLAIDPGIIIAKNPKQFKYGLQTLHLLTKRPIYLNSALNQSIPGVELSYVQHHIWEGKHPAGLVGTHMHFFLPVSSTRTNWHIGYQDIIAIGYLLSEGKLFVDRYVGVCGPSCDNPRIVKTRIGASLNQTIDLNPDRSISKPDQSKSNLRIISGSVLAGRSGSVSCVNYLSRYDNQITMISEGTNRDFFLTKGWLSPGFDKFSILGTYLGKFLPGFQFPMTTSTQGSKRAMVPIGMYEKVMPMDIIPTYLLRALISKDTERAQELGALELDEEDLSLCTFVCSGKYEYGPLLRANLEDIEKNG